MLKKSYLVYFFLIVFMGFLIVYMLLYDDNSSYTGDSSTEQNSNERSLAIVFDNSEPAWLYQSGLNDASIVYEMLVEGGVTRELGIFQSKVVNKFMPIRSARGYMLDYVLENDAIFVHFGYSPKAKSDIETLGIDSVNGLLYENEYFFREDLPIATEHRAYTSTSYINEAIKKLNLKNKSIKKNILNFKDKDESNANDESSTKAELVKVKYSDNYSTSFDYNEINKSYDKFQNEIQIYDYMTKKEISFKNVIIIYISYQSILKDDSGRLNMQNIIVYVIMFGIMMFQTKKINVL